MRATDRISVIATVGTETSIANEEGAAVLALSDLPADVGLEVTAPRGTTDVHVTRDGADVVVAWTPAVEAESAKLTGTIKVTTAELGDYLFKVGDSSAKLTLKAAETVSAPAKPQDAQLVAELEPGENDPWFLLATATAVLVIVIAIVVGVFTAAANIDFPDAPWRVSNDQWVSASYADRVAHIVLLIVAGAGAALLIIGGWLAALETRGRLRQKVKVTRADDSTRGVVEETGKAVAGVVDALKASRGTIAVLSVAGIVLLAVLWASTVIAGDGDGPPAPEQSPSSTSTGTSGGSSDSPTGTSSTPTGGPSDTPTDTPTAPTSSAPGDEAADPTTTGN